MKIKKKKMKENRKIKAKKNPQKTKKLHDFVNQYQLITV